MYVIVADVLTAGPGPPECLLKKIMAEDRLRMHLNRRYRRPCNVLSVVFLQIIAMLAIKIFSILLIAIRIDLDPKEAIRIDYHQEKDTKESQNGILSVNGHKHPFLQNDFNLQKKERSFIITLRVRGIQKGILSWYRRRRNRGRCTNTVYRRFTIS